MSPNQIAMAIDLSVAAHVVIAFLVGVVWGRKVAISPKRKVLPTVGLCFLLLDVSIVAFARTWLALGL